MTYSITYSNRTFTLGQNQLLTVLLSGIKVELGQVEQEKDEPMKTELQQTPELDSLNRDANGIAMALHRDMLEEEKAIDAKLDAWEAKAKALLAKLETKAAARKS